MGIIYKFKLLSLHPYHLNNKGQYYMKKEKKGKVKGTTKRKRRKEEEEYTW